MIQPEIAFAELTERAQLGAINDSLGK
jgi:hypothetical protein